MGETGTTGVRGLRAGRSFASTGALMLGLAVALPALEGCSVPVEVGLDDAEANRVFLALDRAGVDALKEQDPTAEGRWRVSVAREDVALALQAMREDDLPRRPTSAGDSAGGKGALVPSEAAERAQLLAAIAAEVAATLESIEGVLAARVHLSDGSNGSVGARTGLLQEATAAARPSASVLFEYRGATPPVSADSVQRLVAGAVAGLAPMDVAVVLVSRTAPASSPGGGLLAHVGPIAVARSSARKLQAALAGLVSIAAILAGAVLLLYSRLAQTRGKLEASSSAAPGDEPSPAERVERTDGEQRAGLRRGA